MEGTTTIDDVPSDALAAIFQLFQPKERYCCGGGEEAQNRVTPPKICIMRERYPIIPSPHTERSCLCACRVSQLSLVCKNWKREEREHPYQPVRLRLKPDELASAFLIWRLRDASRLQEVSALGEETTEIEALSSDQSQGMLDLLQLLSEKAPMLQSLAIKVPMLKVAAKKAWFPYVSHADDDDEFYSLLGARGDS